jgi:hypothetical protein
MVGGHVMMECSQVVVFSDPILRKIVFEAVNSETIERFTGLS